MHCGCYDLWYGQNAHPVGAMAKSAVPLCTAEGARGSIPTGDIVAYLFSDSHMSLELTNFYWYLKVLIKIFFKYHFYKQ